MTEELSMILGVILDDIKRAMSLAQKYNTSKHEELKRALDRLLKSGAGEHRIREACRSLSLADQALVLDALDSLLNPTSRKIGEDLEDPEKVIAYTDAGCYPNPGPGVCVAVLLREDGAEIGRYRRELGHVTSNEAEYHGIILAIESTLNSGYKRLEVRSDSELLVQQLKGCYTVHARNLVPLYKRVRELMKRFDYIRFVYVPREMNATAHGVCRRN